MYIYMYIYIQMISFTSPVGGDKIEILRNFQKVSTHILHTCVRTKILYLF
jgi:hypothetical protein